jgi:hypothetical protein
MGSGFGLAAVFPGLVMPALLLIALAFGVFLPNIDNLDQSGMSRLKKRRGHTSHARLTTYIKERS